MNIEPDGSFVLPGLASGLHKLVVRHPLLDTLGLPAPVAEVESVLGQMTHVTLRMPTLADAMSEVCGGKLRPPQTAPLLGRVIDTAGRPLSDIAVKLERLATADFEPQWLSMPRGPAGETPSEWTLASEADLTTVETKTDSRGIFVLCDVPHGSRLRLDIARSDGTGESRRPVVPSGAQVAIVVVTIEDRG